MRRERPRAQQLLQAHSLVLRKPAQSGDGQGVAARRGGQLRGVGEGDGEARLLQADALKLVAKKLQSSLAVEGELPEDGLAAYGDDGDDLMLALARKIVAGEEDADSVESASARLSPRAFPCSSGR